MDHGPVSIPGAQGPWGAPVAMAAPYSAAPPSGEATARAMLAQSMPMDLVQAGFAAAGGAPSGIIQAGGPGAISPPGVPSGPGVPGMAGPPPGAVAAVGAITSPMPNRFSSRRTEVRFVGPAGMKVSWYAPGMGGPGFTTNFLDVPGRYNFVQGAIYRLKLTNIPGPGRAGMELFPTLEVVPSSLRTDTFLAHSAVPVAFTEEDLEQVAAGNFLVKVIYLPDPQFQDLTTVAPDEIVSTRLEPGADPIAVAQRRGSILLVVRLGNIDLEAPNSPAMDAPSPYGNGGACPPGMGAMGPGMPMMGPHGPMGMPGMTGMPGMPMPGPNGGAAGMPVMHTPNGSGLPVSKLPDPSVVQQTSYSPNPTKSPYASSDSKSAWRPWWQAGSNGADNK
jgi:hypothetical protein